MSTFVYMTRCDGCGHCVDICPSDMSFFTIFEIDAHKQISKGTTIDEISKTYLQNLKEQFGNSVNLS